MSHATGASNAAGIRPLDAPTRNVAPRRCVQCAASEDVQMKCPACNHEWKLPGPQAGGRKGGKKGYAVTPMSAAARKSAWKTRKAQAKRSPNAELHSSECSKAERR